MHTFSAVEATLVIEPLAAQRLVNYHELFLETVQTFTERPSFNADRGVVGDVVPSPYAELEPTSRDSVDSDRLSGQEDRVAESYLANERTDAQPRRNRCQGAEQGPRFIVHCAPEAQGVDKPGAVEAHFVGRFPALGDVRERAGREREHVEEKLHFTEMMRHTQARIAGARCLCGLGLALTHPYQFAGTGSL